MKHDDQAVIVGLSGGLGNQMFQYAAGRALALRLGQALSLDLSWFAGRRERSFGLAHFEIAANTLQQKLPLAGLVRLQSRIARKWATRHRGRSLFRERQFHFDPAFNGLAEPVYLEGYWQSPRYFAGHADQIRQDFALATPLPPHCAPILRTMDACDPICVHVRRGDYVSNPAAASVHGLCGIDYYQRGVVLAAQGLARPHALVFSDDPGWVRQALQLPVEMTVVDVNSAGQAHWDLHLMAACRHFVIANSSLSWWGAWLGTATDKRVIAPQKWFIDTRRDTRDLIPADWVRT